MIEYVFFFYGSERTETDVQKNARYLNARCVYFFEKFRSKMQTRCRRSRRTVSLAIHGLVSVLVFKLFSDIRRERHIAYLVEDIFENAVERKLYIPESFLFIGGDFARKFV